MKLRVVQAWGFGFKPSFVWIYPSESLILTLEQQLQHGSHRGLEGPAVSLWASNVGICSNTLKGNVSLPRDAEQLFLYKINSDICECRRWIAAHGLTSSEPIQFWQDFQECHFLN
uniref:Uncharacterized protein n=1 Tax=Zonotrichia albicollis TaxID=44394 RepID=A0A8D2MMW8_ZONAL